MSTMNVDAKKKKLSLAFSNLISAVGRKNGNHISQVPPENNYRARVTREGTTSARSANSELAAGTQKEISVPKKGIDTPAPLKKQPPVAAPSERSIPSPPLTGSDHESPDNGNGVNHENTPSNPPGAKKGQTPRLMDILVENGVVDKEQVAQAIEMQKNSTDKRRLLDILVDDLGVDREAIFGLVARYYAFETVDPSIIFGNQEKLRFIKQTLQMLSQSYYETAVKRKILPYEVFTNGTEKLAVITPDTTHPDVHLVARAFQSYKYEIKYVTIANWNELWRQLAFDKGTKQMGMDMEDEFGQVDADEAENELVLSLEEEIGRGKISELVEGILIDGVRTGI